MNAKQEYLDLVAGARRRLDHDERLISILDGQDADIMHQFLMRLSAWGIQMTQPVEEWITRAGKACIVQGFHELGENLVKHAKNEAGHEGMFAQDLTYLVDRWNDTSDRKVTALDLLAAPVPASVKAYVAVHEAYIGTSPYVQLGIEYEVERMTPIVGPRLVQQCVQVLGPEIVKGLCFVQEHVAVDVGHTTFNERQLDRLLLQHPGAARPLGLAGAFALHSYVDFLGDCLDAAYGWWR